jgi:hypothetical protein
VLCIIDGVGLLRNNSEFQLFDEMPKSRVLAQFSAYVFAFAVLSILGLVCFYVHAQLLRSGSPVVNTMIKIFIMLEF